ncbi:hypothetical protein SLS53_001669 [Cytospora paraplurivora]|uniref:Major facilitator superfamily (MFS) profile domain-containing protein n=1 Tax=Cytospora paraplurivora TaxID=2898453 RepID=A0AAN9UFM7_9PEZI
MDATKADIEPKNHVRDELGLGSKGHGVAVIVDDDTAIDWSEDEERRVKAKIDFILLPILAVAFFALQMDRGNISNALTSTITEDIGVTTNQINVGTALLSAGIVILEIPSNIMLQRIGPHRWLSGQIIAWGLVALFQNFMTSYAGYLVTRIILGLCESGFIPGSLYTLSTWYKRDETSLRVSIFFVGSTISSAVTSLIGAGILSMGDRYGIAGWRWLFIIEGAITIGIGLLFLLLLPPRAGDSRPLISLGRWSYFDRRESYILVRRVQLDDPAKTAAHRRISASDVRRTVGNPRFIMHALITMTATASIGGINTYSPSVIKSFGYGTVRANAMASVGTFISAVMLILLGWLADKTGRHGPVLLFGALWSLIAFACVRESQIDDWSKGMKYAAIVFSTSTVVHVNNVAWASANSQGPAERSIVMAMIIMAANSGGIAGSQIFRTQDKPLYLHAFTACLALAALNILEIVGMSAWYFLSNRKLAKGAVEAPIIKGATEVTADGHQEAIVRIWRWKW